jgi:CMP-N-acetylneuraminic acid synthetase
VIADRRVLAVVPARGGSKGIPLKNLRTVGGRSLVALAGDVVRQVPEIDRAVVSTDHAEIARVAKEAGLDAPFMRPESISGDRIGDFDVLIHALESTEAADGRRYDIVVMLQPTSPLRTPLQVSSTIRMLVEGGWDSVWTLSPTDSKSHPLKQMTVDGSAALGYYDPRGAEIIARQQLRPVYHRNGVAYAMTRDCLAEQKSIKGRKAGALVIEGDHVSIDTEHDIALVEWILKRRARGIIS